MSLHPQPIGEIPEATVRTARAAFRKGNTIMRLRDEFGTLYTDADFARLFPTRGQPALAPWRLALVTVFQYLENLTDRQAADQVRGRIDWKYALGLELTDPGFDFSVLSEFRGRLIQGQAEQVLLDRMLAHFKDQGLVKARGKQRTDSTHVLAAVRSLNRLEFLAETLRAALNSAATVAPEWLRGVTTPEWVERYGHRVEDYRLPNSKTARAEYAKTVGQDGFTLLDALEQSDVTQVLKHLPQVETLQLVWSQQYERQNGEVKLRDRAELPRAGLRPASPYDPQARVGAKRGMGWLGYKCHVTETCDDDEVHLIIHVQTTIGSSQDVTCTDRIQAELVQQGLPPAEHFVDAGYVDAGLLVDSAKRGIELIGPLRQRTNWQEKDEAAFDGSHFTVNWEAQHATCPQGKVSSSRHEVQDKYGRPSVAFKFLRRDCDVCPVRARCVQSPIQPRMLKVPPREVYEALQVARARESENRERFHRRAGVEGTISQGVSRCGLRRARYWGLAKTHLQHVAIAAAINVARVTAWVAEVPRAKETPSRFAALHA